MKQNINEVNAKVFDEVEEEPTETEEVSFEEPESQNSEQITFDDESIDDKIKKRGEHIECDGQILTITEVTPTLPKLTSNDGKGGIIINKPKVSMNGKSQYYTAKLKVKFDNNMAAYYPQISYFADKSGKLLLNKTTQKPVPTINIMGNNKAAQLLKMVINAMSGNKFKMVPVVVNNFASIVPDENCEKAFYEFAQTISTGAAMKWLIGKKVKIKTVRGKNPVDKQPYFRNDIECFV